MSISTPVCAESWRIRTGTRGLERERVSASAGGCADVLALSTAAIAATLTRLDSDLWKPTHDDGNQCTTAIAAT
eukprot:1479349-Rhodomonas_salina.3